MIAAVNMNGFVDSAVGIALRDSVDVDSNDGTVNSELFVNWVRDYLCPVLGSYEAGKSNSIIIMDNASNHMNRVVKELIEGRGAYLLYMAPYSPDMPPIEYIFNMYKSYF